MNSRDISHQLQNWPTWLKWAVLIQVGFMAFLAVFNSGLINPSLVLLSEAMHKSTTVVAYSTTTAIIFGGVSVCPPSQV
jgi:Co/Zn/Cd efflux system component